MINIRKEDQFVSRMIVTIKGAVKPYSKGLSLNTGMYLFWKGSGKAKQRERIN